MKNLIRILQFFCLLILCGIFILACKKKDEPTKGIIPGPGTTTDTTTVADLDNFSHHLQFIGSVKRQGRVPVGSKGGSSLRKSIKDTLHLVQGVMRPIKFQHLDTTKNISGVYVQVAVIGGSLNSTDYYDVAELKDVAESDTVSVILIGFDPTDMKFPLSFNITVIPYNESGQPLDETTIPVKVEELNDDPKKSGTCGIVLPEGEFWDWELSYKSPAQGSGEFMSSPDIVFGAEGQDIKGSCCGGSSLYGICPGTRIPNASLHFSTFYQIRSETFTFFDNSTFLRQTFVSSANPLPDKSDFCGNAPGVVYESLDHGVYHGNWTINKVTVPQNLKTWYDTRNGLVLQTTSSTGGGYGNGGGIIHQLDCKIGELVLIQVDPEGFGQHLFKFYTRRAPGDQRWYPF